MENQRAGYNGGSGKTGENKNIPAGRHKVTIDDRKNLIMTDIADIDSFDEQEINAKLRSGSVIIKGEKLHIHRLDLREGEVEITGIINSLTYIKAKSKDKGSLIARIMK